MKRGLFGLLILFLALSLPFGCGPSKQDELHNGVIYAKAALQQVGANPFVTASYSGYIRNGKTPAAYITDTLPKKDPPFDSFEYEKPTHPWTVVIRPSGAPNEFSIEGYGLDLKRPLIVEYVTVSLPEE